MAKKKATKAEAELNEAPVSNIENESVEEKLNEVGKVIDEKIVDVLKTVEEKLSNEDKVSTEEKMAKLEKELKPITELIEEFNDITKKKEELESVITRNDAEDYLKKEKQRALELKRKLENMNKNKRISFTNYWNGMSYDF